MNCILKSVLLVLIVNVFFINSSLLYAENDSGHFTDHLVGTHLSQSSLWGVHILFNIVSNNDHYYIEAWSSEGGGDSRELIHVFGRHEEGTYIDPIYGWQVDGTYIDTFYCKPSPPYSDYNHGPGYDYRYVDVIRASKNGPVVLININLSG